MAGLDRTILWYYVHTISAGNKKGQKKPDASATLVRVGNHGCILG